MLIAARNAMMAGGKLSAKSYVQDGLVAMWDGIENAGWGVHDGSVTNWVDLISGEYATPGPYNISSFGDDALIVTRGGQPNYIVPASIGDALNTTTYTIEACITPSSRGGVHGNRSNGTSDTLYDVYVNTSNKITFTAYYGRDIYTADEISLNELHTISVVSGTNTMLYNRGQQIGNGNWTYNPKGGSWGIGGSFNMFGAIGKYHRFSIYSHALTADEIAHNYAVDKARFGLP